MKNTLTLIFLLLTTVAAPAAMAEKTVLQHLSVPDGLSNSYVTSISQDKRGYMWIGTDAGLNKFDGDRFHHFTLMNSKLPSNAVNRLHYDEENDRLWVGTKKGLAVIDCASMEVTQPEIPDTCILNNIIDFFSYDGLVFAVNNRRTIAGFNRQGKVERAFNMCLYDSIGNETFAHCFVQDSKGTVYIGMASQGLYVYDTATGRKTIYRHNPSDPTSLPSNTVNTVFIDHYENVWVGTTRGLSLFNPKNGEFLTHHHESGNPASLAGDNVYCIMETDKSTLWIGTDVGGVSILDLSNIAFTGAEKLSFRSLPPVYDPDGLSSNNIRSMFLDSFGNIWIGNYSEGLDILTHATTAFRCVDYFSHNAPGHHDKAVWSLMSTPDGKLWAGTDNEIVVLSGQEVEKSYNLSPHFTGAPAPVTAMAWLDDMIVFSLFEDGVLTLDPKTGKIERLHTDRNNNYANTIYTTPEGKTLFGMQDGLYVLEGKNVVKDHLRSYYINHLIPNGITTDNEGNLWLGTYGNGIQVLGPEGKPVAQLQNRDGLSSDANMHLFKDSRGWIWIAGQDGLSVVRDTSNPLKYSNVELTNDDIHFRAITEDINGDIWGSTNNSVLHWDHKTGNVERYDTYYGLPDGNFMTHAAVSTPDGMLYFGSRHGLGYTYPDTLHFAKPDNLPIRIVGFIEENIDSHNTIQISPDSGGSITVPYHVNSLRFAFSVPDFSYSRLMEYSYMIEGMDKTWTRIDNDHVATIHNVVPGKYTLLVRGRLRNSPWQEASIATLKMTVEPPIWQSWYAKVFYLIALFALAYSLIRFYKRRLQQRSSYELERRKNIDAQELNNERLRFYTNVTHELRTPLTLIIGPLEDLAGDPNLPPQYARRIKAIHASTLRLLNLINQLLEFRKTETQNRRLSVARGRIGNLITEIGLRYKELNRNPQVSIDIDIDPTVGDIYYDSEVITTIVNNLMSNAMKYTEKGNISMSLKRVNRGGSGDYAQITVSDTGYGIDAKALPYIFDRYYQADGKHQASGTGIGLALVKSLSELHGGIIEVDSKIGQGTLFRFTISCTETYPEALHKESHQGADAASEEETPDTPTDNRPTILVVEDNDDIRDYIETSLNSTYHVLTASNGQEGLDTALSQIPDVIVSDIMMPKMNGTDLCKNVKNDIRTSHIPVILLTAKDSLEDKEEGYDAGADSYITKPFSAKLLRTRIRNILEQRETLARYLGQSPANHSVSRPEKTDATEAPAENAQQLGLTELDRQFLERFKEIVDKYMHLPSISKDILLPELGMSQSTLFRKIKSLTGIGPTELIRRIKLQKAYEMLEQGWNVSETSTHCGFGDSSYFSQCFKKEFGISPSQLSKSKKSNPNLNIKS